MPLKSYAYGERNGAFISASTLGAVMVLLSTSAAMPMSLRSRLTSLNDASKRTSRFSMMQMSVFMRISKREKSLPFSVLLALV